MSWIFVTSPSSRTSTTGRPPSSTRCSARLGPSAPISIVEERVMDSNPLEKERGITILAKNTADHLARREDQHRRHAGARRLRWRSRAHPAHGRRRADPGGRGRRPDAADALRDPQGARRSGCSRSWRSTRSTARTPSRCACTTKCCRCSWTSRPRKRSSTAPFLYTSSRAGHRHAGPGRSRAPTSRRSSRPS